MKSTPLRLTIALILIIGTVYAVSVIVTKEILTIAILFIAFAVVKFIVRTMLYIFFKVLKWAVIIAVIGLILATLF